MSKSPVIPKDAQSGNGTISAQWEGPLPPPGALRQFNDIIPNGANRIMEMVEREQAHRIAHDDKMLEAMARDYRRGHIIGLALGILSIAGAVFTAYIGTHPSVSVALVGLPVAMLIRSVITRR